MMRKLYWPWKHETVSHLTLKAIPIHRLSLAILNYSYLDSWQLFRPFNADIAQTLLLTHFWINGNENKKYYHTSDLVIL